MNPWLLCGATFVAGLLAQMIFPRHRWGVAIVIAVAPLFLLTATIWWRVWEHDALYLIAYIVALLICCGASLLSLLAVEAARRVLRR